MGILKRLKPPENSKKYLEKKAGPLSWSKLEFGYVGFYEGRKTGEPEENLEVMRKPAAKSTYIRDRAGIEPGPHWREVSALITAPTLSPYTFSQDICCDKYKEREFKKHQVSRSDCASRLTFSGDDLPKQKHKAVKHIDGCEQKYKGGIKGTKVTQSSGE